MSNINKRPLKVALHGMDNRANKMMAMYFQGPCKGAALLVPDQENADVDMFDGDVPASKKIMTSYLQKPLLRPMIILSLQEFVHEGAFHIKKPVNVDDMLRVIVDTKKFANAYARKSAIKQKIATSRQAVEPEDIQQDMLEFDIDQAKLFSSGETSDENANIGSAAVGQVLGKKIIALSDYKAMDGSRSSIPNNIEAESQHPTSKPIAIDKNKDGNSDSAKNQLATSSDPYEKPKVIETDNIEKDWFDEWFESQSTNSEE